MHNTAIVLLKIAFFFRSLVVYITVVNNIMYISNNLVYLYPKPAFL